MIFSRLTTRGQHSQPLERYLWRSYFNAAIIPLLLIELSFLGIYWLSSRTTYDRNVEAIEKVSRDYLVDVSQREAEAINATLEGIAGQSRVFASQTAHALQTPHTPSATERARYAFSPSGAFYSRHEAAADKPAVFYSGYTPIGPREIEKVWRTTPLDPLMRDIKASSPLISQIYLNTNDSFNRIYPAFDVLEQYPVRMNITSYNFYYEADAAHNPTRKAVWTDAYIDPAGAGWMVSSIAPAYIENRLEAVIGIDVTIETIIRRILDLDLPWSGYAVLVGRDGTILALPEQGEEDFGLTELKGHRYSEAIKSDTLKPESFNLNKRKDLAPLAQAIRTGKDGATELELNGRRVLAAQAAIAGPGWHLVVLAPANAIFADATTLRSRLYTIGGLMVIVLLMFYAAFFVHLSIRARRMSQSVAEPLSELEQMMAHIGDGDYEQREMDSGIAELDAVAERLGQTRARLGAAHAHIVEQQQTVRKAFERERRITRGQRRFIDMLSHEFRTQLSVVDSSAQILERRAERLSPDSLRERASMLRRAVERVNDVIESALRLIRLEEGGLSFRRVSIDLRAMIGELTDSARAAHPDIPIDLDCEELDQPLTGDRELMRAALDAVIDNALRYSPPGEAIAIRGKIANGQATIEISDHGSGMSAEDLSHVCEPFFRGANSTAIPGAGVGLYLASTCADLHGGHLEIASQPGTGTRVIFHLPLERV